MNNSNSKMYSTLFMPRHHKALYIMDYSANICRAF